jgi:hypothetical protein
LDESFEAVKQRFGAQSYDSEGLRVSARGLAARLKQESGGWESLEGWTKLANTQANHLRVSQPRNAFTDDSEKTLQELYEHLVYLKPARRERQRKPDLRRVFEGELRGVPWERDVEVEIPELGERLGRMHIPYAYKNGCLNLVTSEAFPRNEADAVSKANGLAVRGGLIAKRPGADGLGRQLVVVGSLPSGARGDARDAIQGILREYNTRLVFEEQLGEFVEEVRTHAHA